LFLLALFAPASQSTARGGKAIDSNYLSITDCPNEPGCPALVLPDETELSNASAREASQVADRQVVVLKKEAAL